MLRGFLSMPIYEYQCAACSKVSEMLQKFSDPAPSQCEACGSGPLQKLISQSSFVLNGTGWYVTDFRGGNKKPADPEKDAKPPAEDAKAPAEAAKSPAEATKSPGEAEKSSAEGAKSSAP